MRVQLLQGLFQNANFCLVGIDLSIKVKVSHPIKEEKQHIRQIHTFIHTGVSRTKFFLRKRRNLALARLRASRFCRFSSSC